MPRELVNIDGWKLLPAPPNTCEQCAVNHSPEQPHNAQSLHYQYWFYGKHGRWPDWRDALAHCDERIRANWIAALSARGVDVMAGEVNPKKN